MGIEVHKVYLSAILDLCDRRIVSYKISNHNDNALVMDTFDQAVKIEPDAHPLFIRTEDSNIPARLLSSSEEAPYETKYVQSRTLYRQWSNGRILGNLKTRDVLWEMLYIKRRINPKHPELY